jgi:hypothetical protein
MIKMCIDINMHVNMCPYVHTCGLMFSTALFITNDHIYTLITDLELKISIRCSLPDSTFVEFSFLNIIFSWY